MSQVIFKASMPLNQGTQVQVVAGWDRPLQEYFLTVFLLEGDDEVWWSTMDEPSPADKLRTEHLQQKLASFGIESPQGFWERVQRREANVYHIYQDSVWKEF